MHGIDRITTVEMHTGGEPVRIVTGGYPPLEGATLLEKRRYARDRLDHLRRMLMAEPRGHADMYGALLVAPDLPDADLAVLFLHNDGYSTMCGHAVIALGRYAVDRGLVPVREPETTVRIQCPCGLVTARVEVADGRAGRVRFSSVPAFVLARDAVVVTERFGPGHARHCLWRRLLRRAAGSRARARPAAQPAVADRRSRPGNQGGGHGSNLLWRIPRNRIWRFYMA